MNSPPRPPRRPPQKRVICLVCYEHVESTVLGRCPQCMRTEATAQAGSWVTTAVLTRSYKRFDGRALVIRVIEESRGWSVHIFEGAYGGEPNEHAPLGNRTDLSAALQEVEGFARRWLERAPGTAVATYVARPNEPS